MVLNRVFNLGPKSQVGDLIKMNDHKSSRSISLVVFTSKTDYPCDLQNPSKLTDEQMDCSSKIKH